MDKLKLLVIGDGGAKTGFARVLHSIIDNLPADDYVVHHLAINYKGDPFPTVGWHYLYPAHLGGDLIGLGRLKDMLQKVKPDVVFILNDLWLLQMYIKQLPTDYLAKTVVYFPVDGEYSDSEWINQFDLLGGRFAYTEFGASEIAKINPHLPVGIIPHGIDTATFFPIEREQARKLMHIPEDKHNFIILNANRNQPRKRIDLTIKAFAEFVKDKPMGVSLYLHMGTKDAGWDILKLAKRYGIDKRLILTGLNISPVNFVSDEVLNYIYNSCDIGLNTAMGEGWGLPNMEHAVTSSAQVVPNASATRELFHDCGKLIDIHDEYTYPEMLTEGKVISVPSLVSILNELYENSSLRDQIGLASFNKFSDARYSWQSIASQWDAVFKQVADANTVA